MSDFNTMVIDEFRRKGGVVTEAAPFGDALVILHATGAKSGEPRVNPLASPVIDGKRLLIASYAGADEHPAWYHNLVANPDASIEVGVDGEIVTEQVVARETDEPERTELFEQVKAWSPGFAEYEEATDRTIPVFVLEPA